MSGTTGIEDTLRRIFAAFSTGDYEAAIEFAHPEIELVRPGGQRPLVGAENLRAWMEPEAFESQLIDPVEMTVVGDKVLVLQDATLRGAGSGVELDFRSYSVWTFDAEGRVTRLEVYLPHEGAEARRAAGLPE